MCEKILRDMYEIENYILADNMVTENEKNILRAAQLKNRANEIVVIDTCNNLAVHKEVLDEIQRYVNVENIYSAFDIGEYK